MIESHLKFNRITLVAAGLAYLFWWFAVELVLPGSYNPIGSRLAVVCLCWTFGAASYFLPWIARRIELAFSLCAWIATFHYFYLFYMNQADLNWLVGCYITVIFACACLNSPLHLFAYCVYVLILSAALSFYDPYLSKKIFFPGMATILTVAYLSLRSRVSLLHRVRESALRIQSFLDATFEGIVLHDKQIILDVNESAAKLFGYQREEMIGMKVIELVASESQALAQKHISIESEQPYEVTGLRKNKSKVILEVRGKKHLYEGRAVRVAAIQDITEKKKHEQDRIVFEATREALRIRDEFISIASHELKTPLTSIKLQTEMTKMNASSGKEDAYSPERMRHLVDQVDRQADRLVSLIDDMLDASRISLGRFPISKSRFHLSDLLQSLCDSLRDEFQRARCSLQLQIEPHLQIEADPARMEQVIVNLLTNAIKYGAGKPVTVGLTGSENAIEIFVKDQGIGIEKVNFERIFQRFERAISANSISGMGLGLYICKQIIEAHQGSISVESEVGQGSCFRVRLPRTL